MVRSRLVLIKAFLLVLLCSGLALAQSNTPTWSLGEGDDVENKNVSHPLEMFKGWTLLYKGYSKSPIAFDSTYDGKARKYPTIGTGEQTRMTNAQDSLKVLNLGVDDEITKANMIVYQPIFHSESEFANEKFARDRHLDLFKSLRGVAILTLSYLDKTVAAGLATTQQQVDQNTQNQLLKQIAWTSSKMANPQREQLYNDTDEKVEACLISTGRPSQHTSENVKRIVMREPCLECLDEENRRMNRIPPKGEGLYAYCVCCAEASSRVNRVTDKSGDAWSLVKRIVYGFREPGTGSGKAAVVAKVVADANWMYGDVTFKSCEDPTRCDQKLQYVYPELNVSDKVKMFRDGPPESCGANNTGCPITQVKITSGICPAIKSLMCLWPHTEENNAIMREFWLQSSLGKFLTSSDIENMHIMLERLSGSLKEEPQCAPARAIARASTIPNGYKMEWNPGGEFGRWLDGFCDAAAFSAFKKYHYRMSAIMEDHIAMNFKSTNNEKKMMRELMGRVSTDINLAEADRGASDVSDRMMEGLNMAATRQRVTQVAAGAESLDAQRENRGMTGSIKSWNLFTGGPRESVTSTITYPSFP